MDEGALSKAEAVPLTFRQPHTLALSAAVLGPAAGTFIVWLAAVGGVLIEAIQNYGLVGGDRPNAALLLLLPFMMMFGYYLGIIPSALAAVGLFVYLRRGGRHPWRAYPGMGAITPPLCLLVSDAWTLAHGRTPNVAPGFYASGAGLGFGAALICLLVLRAPIRRVLAAAKVMA